MQSMIKISNVEVLTDGNFIVSWHEWNESAGSGKIFHKTFDAEGSVVSAQAEISSVTWGSAEVRTLNLTDTTFVTTYDDTSAQILDYDGNVIKAEFRLSDTTNFEEGNARLAETEDGFAAFWTRHNGDGNLHGSMARYFNDAGEPITDVFVVNQTIESYQSITDATTLSNGNILVMWTSKTKMVIIMVSMHVSWMGLKFCIRRIYCK